MKPHVCTIFILLILCTGSLVAETPWSYSVGVSSIDYTWADENSVNAFQEQMVGLEIRGSAIVEHTGFYYGTYLSFALPVFGWEIDHLNEISYVNESIYDFYTSFGIPFGYRWAFPRGRSGVYLGAGPSFQALFKFQDYMWGSGGLFFEFGFESLRSKGVSLSFGTRLIMAWGSFATDGYRYAELPTVTTTSIFLGLSWKGTRGY